MKKLTIFYFLLISQIVFGQKSVCVINSLSLKPISDVKIYSSNNELVAISNTFGLFQINSFPITLKHWNYDSENVKKEKDTIFLKAKPQQIEEVKVSPIDFQKVYDKLVKKTSQAILKDTTTIVRGIYFESILEIDLTTLDSTLLVKECNITLLQDKKKKKIDYSFYPSKGKVRFRSSGSDSINIKRISNIPTYIPEFKNLVHFDFSQPKKFNLDVENYHTKINKGEINSLFFYRDHESSLKTKSKINNQVNYINNRITLWKSNADLLSPTDSITKKFGVAIKELDMTIELLLTENQYRIKNIIFKRAIIIKSYDGSLREYHIVKAFLSNTNSSKEAITETKNVENYFKSIKAVENKNLLEMYQF